jgi:hypothetical protein
MFEELAGLKRKLIPLVLNVRKVIQCSELPQSGSGAKRVINGPRQLLRTLCF